MKPGKDTSENRWSITRLFPFCFAGVILFSCGESPTGSQADQTPPAATCQGNPGQPLVVVYPNGGEQLTVGQTATLQFCTADTVNFPIADERRPSVWLSPDDGKTWCMVFEYINQSTVEWVIPEKLQDFEGNDIAIVSNTCRLQISDYVVTDILDISDGAFSIGQ